MTKWDFTLLLWGGFAFAAILFIGWCVAALAMMNAQAMLPPTPYYIPPPPPPPPPAAPEASDALPRTLH
jgi:hypothetical protein